MVQQVGEIRSVKRPARFWVTVVLIAGLMLGSGGVTYAAATWYSEIKYQVSGGITYNMRSIGDSYGAGHGTGIINANSIRQTNQLRVSPRLYTVSGGHQCLSTAWSYNPSPGTHHNNKKTNFCDYNAYYYSQAIVGWWNGNGYTNSTAFRTVDFHIDP